MSNALCGIYHVFKTIVKYIDCDRIRERENVMYILLYGQLDTYADWRYEIVMGILVA